MFVPCALSLETPSVSNHQGSVSTFLMTSLIYTAALKVNAAARSSSHLSDEKHSHKMREKAASDCLEPITTGALLIQSLLRLHPPHNTPVLDGWAQGGLYIMSNSDYVHVVSSHCHHKSYSLSHITQPVRGSSMPSLTDQPFLTDHGMLCSVSWKRSSRTSSMHQRPHWCQSRRALLGGS